MNRTKWFDRKFTFDFPVGLFFCVVERLRGTPARLEEMIAGYPSEVLTERVGGAWSIQEHVGHLIDLEELHGGRLDDFDADEERLRPADLTNKKTQEANHNADSIENLLAMFRDTRHRFVARIEAMDENDVAKSSLHPRLEQPMRVVDMVFFVAEHDDHHMAIMTDLARTLTKEDG